jgi:hypothetical protein
MGFSAYKNTAQGRLREVSAPSMCSVASNLRLDDGVVDIARGALMNHAGDLNKGGNSKLIYNNTNKLDRLLSNGHRFLSHLRHSRAKIVY